MNEQNLIPAKKGEVRNPKGKPKGTKNRSTIARQYLEAMSDGVDPMTGDSLKITHEEFMTLALIKKAREGDPQAYKALMDSAFGSPVQQVDSNVNLDNFSIKDIYKKRD